MTANIFSVIGGMTFSVAPRLHGSQHKGISLGGAQDQTSYQTAYNMFDKPTDFMAVEMIYPAKIIAEEDMLIVLCGASYYKTIIDDEQILYNTIISVDKGSCIKFSGAKKGFRTLVFAVSQSSKNIYLVGKTRTTSIQQFINSNNRNNIIRVFKGPEFYVLKDNTLFQKSWKISPNSSQMGISLDGCDIPMNNIEMISQPVVDGTIQLSPNGAIALMRHRQTIGGYPRVLTIIEPDIDKLSQFATESSVIFKLIDFEIAVEINSQYKSLFI